MLPYGLITNSYLGTGCVNMTNLNTTGSKTSSTFLRGDGQWSQIAASNILTCYIENLTNLYTNSNAGLPNNTILYSCLAGTLTINVSIDNGTTAGLWNGWTRSGIKSTNNSNADTNYMGINSDRFYYISTEREGVTPSKEERKRCVNG